MDIPRRRADGRDRPTFRFKRLKNRNRAERFVAEIKALKTLSHPGILSIVETGEADGMPYYMAEYCENGDLSKWEPTKTTLLEKVKLFRQIADAVSAAHAAKIIHRDLKPFNILVRANGAMAVGDFGLCIHLNDLDGRLTTLNEPVGLEITWPPNWKTEDSKILSRRRMCTPSESFYISYSLGGRFPGRSIELAPFDLLQPG